MPAQRLVGAILESLILVGIAALSFVVPSVAGASCELTVEPEEATAGSVFHVQGSGFSPTALTLKRDGGKATTFPLDLGGADPFDVPVGSKESDAGTWHVTASQQGVCSASTTFVATMASTDRAVLASTPAPAQRLPVSVYFVVIALGFVGGAVAATGLLRTLSTRRVRR